MKAELLCIAEEETNFLAFRFEGFDSETTHLRTPNERILEDKKIELLVSKGLTYVKIGDRLETSESAIKSKLVFLQKRLQI